VSSAEQYRSYADECFGWARTAKTAREREIFIQMAQTWLTAAVRAGVGDTAPQTIQPSLSPATIAKQQTRS
jgi:hypothetical protein